MAQLQALDVADEARAERNSAAEEMNFMGPSGGAGQHKKTRP